MVLHTLTSITKMEVDNISSRIIRVPFKAWMAMERVMNAPQKTWSVDSDWVRTPRYKAGRLRRRMYMCIDIPTPKELEDEL